MLIIVISLLMEKKPVNLKLTMKMLTFQLNFVLKVFLMDLVILSLENIHKHLMKKNNIKIMFSLLIVLFSFSESLACNRTECLFLNDVPCIVRPALIDMNPVELRFYPFMISLNKCTGSCNVCLQKYVFQKKQKTYMLKHLI